MGIVTLDTSCFCCLRSNIGPGTYTLVHEYNTKEKATSLLLITMASFETRMHMSDSHRSILNRFKPLPCFCVKTTNAKANRILCTFYGEKTGCYSTNPVLFFILQIISLLVYKSKTNSMRCSYIIDSLCFQDCVYIYIRVIRVNIDMESNIIYPLQTDHIVHILWLFRKDRMRIICAQSVKGIQPNLHTPISN